MSFFFETLIAAQTVVEETVLPDDAGLFGDETFPVAKNIFHANARWKRKECVEVVRHREEERGPNFFSGHVVLQGGGHHFECSGRGELVRGSLGAADRDEEDFAGGNP